MSLTRQLFVYDDKVTIVFKWIYYLVFVAFCEELEYRALMPAILKNRVHKYVEWILRIVTDEYDVEVCPGDYFFILRGILLKVESVN